MGNCDRTKPVKIFGPQGLKEVINGLMVIAPNLPFQLELIEFDYEDKVREIFPKTFMGYTHLTKKLVFKE